MTMTDTAKPDADDVREETLTMAERIRVGLAEKGWTQSRLAQEAGISQGNLSRYMRGQVNPGADVLNRIFKVLGKSHALAAVDGALGIQGRTAGKLTVVDPMAEPVPIEWIAEGLVARDFLTMMAGEGGAGKSMLTQTLAERYVAGAEDAFGFKLAHRYVIEPCGGCAVCGCPRDTHKGDGPCANAASVAEPVTEPCDCDGYDHAGDCTVGTDGVCNGGRRLDSRVLILDAENAANIIQQRAQDMGREPDAAARYIAAASDGFDIYKDRKDLDAMLADLRDAGTPVDLLIIDSFTSMWMGNENSGEQVTAVLKYLNTLALRFHLGILLIHHMDKEGNDFRGHSSIQATIGGAMFLFTRYDEKEGQDWSARHLSCRKMRIAAEPTPRRLYLTGHGIDIEPDTAADRVTYAVAESTG